MTLDSNKIAGAMACLCLSLSGQAMAACTGAPMAEAALRPVLTGNTVCAIRGNDSWQELHVLGGDLIDYKRGPTDTSDPSEKVGTWSIAGNGQITYNYGPGSSYRFAVRSNGGASYSFCGIGTPDIDVIVKPGGGACLITPAAAAGRSRRN